MTCFRDRVWTHGFDSAAQLLTGDKCQRIRKYSRVMVMGREREDAIPLSHAEGGVGLVWGSRSKRHLKVRLGFAHAEEVDV